VLLVGAPVLTLAGIDPLLWSPPLAQDIAGGAATALGIAGTLWSQAAMGRSWRIGVRAGERTDLVRSGPFAWVRNPIFTAMILGAAGFALILPTVAAIAGLVVLVIGLELQVRVVEEPHLVAVHGDSYDDYRRRVGRFVPLLGRSPFRSP
jgi:protein-S-isoprenylcysteine O-methyltransferase Ste14